ncbi:hypothetical protein CHUAL_012760 [Chamberlinius hualienensis]
MTAETQTYVLVLNSSDLDALALREFHRPQYIHTYTDLLLFSFLIIMSFIFNVILTTTFTTDRYLKQISSYVPVLGLTITQLFDGLFNGVISLVYISRVIWDMGYPLCVMHNFTVHLTLGLSPLILATTAVDRYVCLNYPEVYRNYFTCNKLRLGILSVLFISVAFSLPYVTNILTSRPFPARMSCAGSAASNTSFVVTWALFLICLPILTMILAGIALGYTLWLDKREKRRVQSRAWLEAKGIAVASGLRPPLAHHEVRSIWLWFMLSFIYFACTLPFVINDIVYQLNYEAVYEETEHFDVCLTPYTDVTTTWLRYLATAFNPVAILAISDDVRHEAIALVSRWRAKPSTVITEATTTVDDLVEASTKSTWIKKLLTNSTKSKSAAVANSSASHCPVLYPSNFGLQLRYSTRPGGKYRYAWCDQLDSCCADKAPNRVMSSDSGYDSLSHRQATEETKNGRSSESRFVKSSQQRKVSKHYINKSNLYAKRKSLNEEKIQTKRSRLSSVNQPRRQSLPPQQSKPMKAGRQSRSLDRLYPTNKSNIKSFQTNKRQI